MMQYCDIRHRMKSGQLVGFSHEETETWEDKKVQIVKHVTQSKLSHVGIVWVVESEHGRKVFVIEAVKPMVRIFPLSKLGDFYWFPIDSDLSAEAEVVALNLVGMNYSELEAVGGYFGLNDEGNDVTQCAEVAKIVLKANGMNITKNATPAQVADNVMDTGVAQIKVANPLQSHFF